MKKLPTKEEMTARFWALTDAMDAVRAKVAPLREKRDAAVNKAAEEDRKAMEAIRAIESDVIDGMSMYEAQQELAFYARALNNVGERPAAV